MATYLGNASLSSAVKERVLSTFQQAVTLFKQGRIDEVVQGCGLILRMDPMFDPAKKLLEKARNPSAPIDVDALLPGDDRRLLDARAAIRSHASTLKQPPGGANCSGRARKPGPDWRRRGF